MHNLLLAHATSSHQDFDRHEKAIVTHVLNFRQEKEQ